MSAAGSPPGDASNLGASTSSSGPRKRGGRAGGASGAGSSSRGGRGRGRGQARAVDDDYEESNKQQQQQAQQQAQQQQAYMYQQQQMQAQAAAQAQAAQAQQQMQQQQQQQQQAHNEDRPRQSKTERRAGQRLSRRNLFEKDLPTLMYAFGDDRDPLPESVSVLEDIVVDYLSELCKSAAAHSPNAKKVRLDDLRFALRRPQQGKQLARLEELLYLQEDIARARKFMTDATAGIKE